jgi:hypothetical protein
MARAIRRLRKLKPAARVTTTELSAALNHIRARVAGEISLKKTLATLVPQKERSKNSTQELEAELPAEVKLATDLFDAGKITKSEYFFYCGFHIVRLHESYHMDGTYDSGLREINASMEGIERRYGLKENEYWLTSDAPEEYLRESAKYDLIVDEKQLDLFQRFAPALLTDQLRSDAKTFWRLYERGRRSVFEKEDHLASALDLVELYEGEAEKSANAEAYYAAITMLGSAAEARILLECLRQPTKTRALVGGLPKKSRPKSANPLNWTLVDLLRVAELAGWLPNIDDGEVVHIVLGWAHRLRLTRNLLHPGRHIVERPHARLGKEEWLDAISAHTALRRAIELARKKERAPKEKNR